MSDGLGERYEVREIDIAGRPQRGCFALRELAAGAVVCTFGGPLYTRAEMRELVLSGVVRDGVDPFELGLDLYVRLDDQYLAFNHSCEPSAGLSGRASLIALRDLAVGDEITYDYATNNSVHNTYEMPFDCACGAPSCRRRIGNLASIPLDRLRDYLRKGALQDYIRGEAEELLRAAGAPG